MELPDADDKEGAEDEEDDHVEGVRDDAQVEARTGDGYKRKKRQRTISGDCECHTRVAEHRQVAERSVVVNDGIAGSRVRIE